MTSATLQNDFSQTRAAKRTATISAAISPFRVVIGFVLASLLWKGYAYPFIFACYTSCQLTDEFFPALLSDPMVLAGLLLVPVLAAFLALFSRNKTMLRIQSATITLSMLGLCIHQGSYNDATFVTCFWVGLWCTWYAWRIDDPAEELIAKGKVFAILVISMIFLGGAVGKLTPGYWSGQVLYEIYFVDRDFWFFNLLRANFEPESLRQFATYYSRMVIVTETGSAFLWLLPPKIAAALALSVLLGLTIFSNFNLFSVTFCLIGLCLFGLHESKAKSSKPRGSA